nr:MAG TPA: hypothetical protein [Caudoviricetes sp.]
MRIFAVLNSSRLIRVAEHRLIAQLGCLGIFCALILSLKHRRLPSRLHFCSTSEYCELFSDNGKCSRFLLHSDVAVLRKLNSSQYE